MSYLYANEFKITSGQTFAFKSLPGSFWIKSHTKELIVGEYLNKGKYGYIYSIKETNLVVKFIPIDIYLLEDCQWEDPEIQANLDHIDCVHKTTENEFNKELKTSIKMGKEDIGPKVSYKNIFEMTIGNKKLRVGAFVMERMQYTLEEYYDKIKTSKIFESLWHEAQMCIVYQKIRSFKLNVFHSDLHFNNIMVDIDENMTIINLRFIDYGILESLKEYLSRQTHLECYLWENYRVKEKLN